MNILENAVRYSPSGNEVVVSAKRHEGSVVVDISDSGPGIPKAERQKIFQRFYRIDTSRSRKTGGFGLGLAISKEIVSLHGGSISVAARSGETVEKDNKGKKVGSTFTIVLPIIKERKRLTKRKK
jgi:two-component system sensor histidine kinase SenX3